MCAWGKDGGEGAKADFVQGFPSQLHPPQAQCWVANYTLSSRSLTTKITARMSHRGFFAKPATAGQVKLLDALELSQDNQGGVTISVGRLGLEKSVELVTELLKL